MKGKDKGSSSKKKEPSVVGTSSTSSDRVSTLSDSINQPGQSTTNTALAIASDSSDEIASEPSLKKSKMEKNQPATHTDGSKGQLTVSTASIFQSILEAHSFVDKTLLVREIFQTRWEENGETVIIIHQHPKVMITAPRRFGKSINLDMLYHFLQLEVDEKTGEKITKANLETEPVNDTRNYELFTKVKRLQVMKDKEFVQAHFGKYPVINVSFLCTGCVTTKADAVNVCRDAIHEAFKQHCYLYESLESKLEDDERNVCKKWCTSVGNPANYEEFEPHHVIDGLQTLSRYLKKFHGRRVFVLVDESDSIVSKAIDNVADEKELKHIIAFVIGVVGAVVKDNGDLAGAFITGILDLPGIAMSILLGNLDRDTFAEETPRMKYYGFNLGEVEKLFETFSVDEDLRKKAIAKYNGYYSESGEHVLFNPYAIVEFLRNHRMGDASLKNYWQESGYIQNLRNLFRMSDIKNLLSTLLLGRSFPFTLLAELDLGNLTQLWKSNADPQHEISINLVGTFLLRQGYLAYRRKEEGSTTTDVGIPEDLRSVFLLKMMVHFKEHCGIDETLHTKCQNMLTFLMDPKHGEKEVFTQTVKYFATCMADLLQTTNIHPCTEAGIEGLVGSVILRAGYTCVSQSYNVDENRLDIIAHKDGRGIIIELKYKADSSEAALLQVFTQGYYKEFYNRNHYEDGIKLCVVMGMHFTEKRENEKVKATVHCLRDVEINEVLEELNIEKMDRRRKTKTEEVVRIAIACDNGYKKSFVAKAISFT